jgi:ribonucleotide reductase alpha subunit
MQIVQVPSTKHFRMTDAFLAPYHTQGDPFGSLLARSTYLTKYCRNDETWTDTIRRVVEGNARLASEVSQAEIEALFHLFWTGQALPPGRSLWVGGIDGIPADARYNCWYTTLRSIEDWCWTANQLMLGGGVGVGLGDISQMPVVSAQESRFAVWCKAEHSNYDEVKPDTKAFLNGQTPIFVVPDSREGWVEALRITLRASFEGRDQIVDVSGVRARGLPIKTFGGVACGPGPLTHMLRSAWKLVRGAMGRRMTSVECLDVTNHIGLCIKSGNVRRSALIALGDANDYAFRDAKKDWEAVLSHRHTSNNTIVFRSWDDIANFDWNGLVNDVTQFGEPGILNLPLVWKTDPDAEGVNPCLTGDTRVATQFGLIPIAELASSGHNLKVTTDTRVQPDYSVTLGGIVAGHEIAIRDAVPAFKTSDLEDVYRVTTSHGYTLKATKYHKFPTPDGTFELQNLAVGNELLLQSGEGQWGTAGSEDIGTVIGCLEGDGNFTATTGDAALRFWGEQQYLAEQILPACQHLAATIPPENGHTGIFGVCPVPQRDYSEISSVRLGKALAEIGYREKGHVPEVVWRGTRDCVRGYLRGLFATDGQMPWSKGKQCFSIRLNQSNAELLREVQTLLLNFGIVSMVYPRRDAGFRRFPNGKGGLKDYWCKQEFELVVSKQNAVRFADKIGFLLASHVSTFAEWCSSWDRGPYAESFTDIIVSIEFIGREPVFCTTQPSHHTFIADGIVTGNCGEQALHNREACNLAEIFPANFECATDPETAFQLVTRYTLRQRLTPLQDPQSHAVGQRNMRLGVSLGGVCDFDWTPDQLARWFGVTRLEADKYAKELGVARPITTTTVKPSGTISLLNGSSPGIHAPFAPYYIRRTRIAKNDPMVTPMVEAGVPFEEDVYDKSGKTWVFSFPMKARHTKVTVQTQSLRDQLERQATVQENWADNAVSSTISFTEEERGILAQNLKEFVPRLKSTSCLPHKHGYTQAPYEVIDEAKFNTMSRLIQHDHPLTRGGEMDEGGECAGGVCPVR